VLINPEGAGVSKDAVVDIEGKHLKLSNLDKVLYPAAGFTKGQVIDYYVRVAPVLIPHIAGHPLTLKRYPEGVDHPFFFEKNAAKHRPDWVKTAPIWSEGNNRDVNYILPNDLPTLVWVANLASIELHPSLSLAKDIDCPTMMVFDLDPGPPANIFAESKKPDTLKWNWTSLVPLFLKNQTIEKIRLLKPGVSVSQIYVFVHRIDREKNRSEQAGYGLCRRPNGHVHGDFSGDR
jgi:hypothetical protein